MLGDDVAAFLPEARRQAESLMLDTVRVFRRTKLDDFDPVSGEQLFEDSDVYEGPGRLVMRQVAVRDAVAGQQLLTLQNPRLDLPVAGTEGVREGDRFEIVGRASGRIAGVFPQTLATARRLAVEVVA